MIPSPKFTVFHVYRDEDKVKKLDHPFVLIYISLVE